VKEKIRKIEPGLPDGVHIVPFYDRTQLIQETVGTLKKALTEEIIITIVIIAIFLLHIRSSLVVATTLPLAVLIAFIAMYRFVLIQILCLYQVSPLLLVHWWIWA